MAISKVAKRLKSKYQNKFVIESCRIDNKTKQKSQEIESRRKSGHNLKGEKRIKIKRAKRRGKPRPWRDKTFGGGRTPVTH